MLIFLPFLHLSLAPFSHFCLLFSFFPFISSHFLLPTVFFNPFIIFHLLPLSSLYLFHFPLNYIVFPFCIFLSAALMSAFLYAEGSTCRTETWAVGGSEAPFLALLLVVWSELHYRLSDCFSMVPPTLSSGVFQLFCYHKSCNSEFVASSIIDLGGLISTNFSVMSLR